MLVIEAFGYPDNNFGIQASEVCEDLAQVLKVCILQLVFDEDAFITMQNSGYNVCPN